MKRSLFTAAATFMLAGCATEPPPRQEPPPPPLTPQQQHQQMCSSLTRLTDFYAPNSAMAFALVEKMRNRGCLQ